MDRKARLPRDLQGGHFGRDTWRDDHGGRPRDPVEIVGAEMDHGAGLAEGRGPLIEGRAGADVRSIDWDPVIPKQQRRGDAALAESHDRYLASAGTPRLQQRDGGHAQRTFNVESATSAQNRPRM